MPVPDYQTLMLPILKALADGAETTTTDLRARIATAEGPTPEDVSTRFPSGGSVFANRVGWALLGIERAGLVERVRRAVYRLTGEGEQLLGKEPARVDDKVLRTYYPTFVEWKEGVKRRKQEEQPLQFDPPPQS